MPSGAALAAVIRASRRPILWAASIFLVVAMALQWGWSAAHGTWLERAVIDDATVGVAVHLIQFITPDVGVYGAGSRIKAPGGGINILNGCEGTEVLFLLVAALLATPLSWRVRLIGIAGGALYVFALNQLRLLALFYSYRSDRALFDQLHGLVAPLILIVATLAFYIGVIRSAAPDSSKSEAA